MIKFNNSTYHLKSPNINDHIFGLIQQSNNFYELDMLLAIRDLNLNGIYIDIGAHIGNHTIFFAEECKSTKVISIEADPTTFEVLEKNCKENIKKTYELHNRAIYSKIDKMKIMRPDKNNTGMNRLIPGNEIETISLDDLIFDKTVFDDPIVFIKMDVEGLELDVLYGMQKILQRYAPALSVESVNHGKELDLFLSNLGYKKMGSFNATVTDLWIK